MAAHGALVDVHELGRSFGGRIAVAGITVALGPGQVLGLVGANGGGKSTTLRMLAGLVRPDAGEGRVMGLDVRRAGRRICTRAAYMPQRIALYPDLSVRENLRFRASLRGLDAAAWAPVAARFGLEPALGTSCGLLSDGWARRVQLAATLLGAPPLVLLDEPTAGLDPVARGAVWEQVAAIARDGAAVVVSTHDTEEAEACALVMVLIEGRVAAQGRPQSVIAASMGCRSLSDCIRRLAAEGRGAAMLRGVA